MRLCLYIMSHDQVRFLRFMFLTQSYRSYIYINIYQNVQIIVGSIHFVF